MTLRIAVITIVALIAGRTAFAGNAERADVFTEKELAQGYSDRTVLAKPRASLPAVAATAEAGERVRERFAHLGDLRVIEVAPADSVAATIARLKASAEYEFVEPDYIMTYDATPNDSRFASQWSLDNTGQLTGSTAGADIKARAAWDVISRAPNVIVGHIDTGVRLDHDDIAANLWRNPSPTIGDLHGVRIIRGERSGDVEDDVGHGSHTAGIIGAVGNNGVGIAGIAWQVQLMVLKNGTAAGSLTSDSAACVDYAVARGVHILNCSFGGTGMSQTFFTALKAARDAGVIVVASAGNTGGNNDLTAHYPSNYLLDNMVAVGNSGPTDLPSSTSDFGMSVELFAPGTSIVSLSNTTPSSYASRSGTSMSAPHVTGALALMKARFPGDNYRQLINRLLRGVDRKSVFAGRSLSGGRLDLLNALTGTTNRPFNDDFNDSAVVAGTSFAIRGSNRDATIEPDEPAHPAVNPTGTLWWQWAANTSGTVTITTSGSDFDTSLAVYSGSSPGALTLVAANDDDGSRTTSRVSFEATAGASYRISLAGKNGATGYAQLNLGSAPPNDHFANATVLSGESARASTRIPSATVEPGEPRILDLPGNATLWYRWTAPRSGRFQISAFTFDFDTLLAVYTGPDLANLTLVAANDNTSTGDIANSDSRCTIDATAGTIYHIQVDRKVAGETGEVIVTLVDSVWQFSADWTINCAPAVAADGTLYFGTLSPDRRVYAVNHDGSLKWTYPAGGSIDTGSPAVASDGTIYVGSADGRFTALNPNGTVRWQRNFGLGLIAAVTPAIAADGTVYTHLTDGYLYALNPADGSDKWRLNLSIGSTYTSASIAPDGTIYQASNDRNLYAVNPDGTVKWQLDLGGTVFPSPAIDAAGNIYIATTSGNRVISITPAGIERWRYASVSSVSGSPALSADGTTVYIGSGPDRRLHAINAMTGFARWTYTMGNGVVASTPAIDTDGVIYIGATDWKVYAVNANGTLKRVYDTAQPVNSSPTIVGGMLYVTSRDAKLYAFNLGASAAGGPWPQYAHNPQRTGRALPAGLTFATTPQTRAIRTGDSLVLTASVSASGAASYQWFKDGKPVAGAVSSTHPIARAAPGDTGNYSVHVTHASGTLTSPAATVSVESADPGRLVNLSILTGLAAVGDTFTIGYVVGGAGTTGAKPVLIRAAGPALGTVGVTGFVDDPKFEFFTGATLTAQNDNWGGTVALGAAFASVGAFPFAPASRDAALVTSVTGRDSSVRISAVAGGTGTVLAEVYDLTPAASFTAAVPRLINLSVLKDIDTGITVGFVIGGSAAKRVLIRAIGPALANAPFGLSGTVADPQLALYSGPLRINENDNWGGTPALISAFGATGAFSLSSSSRDAALLTTLAPGAYSVQVSGVSAASGTALVEVYEVP